MDGVVSDATFLDVTGGLAWKLARLRSMSPAEVAWRIEERLSYDAASNTVVMNYRGMHVRLAEDVQRILAAVDALLAPLGRRVQSIVNYEGFKVDGHMYGSASEAAGKR